MHTYSSPVFGLASIRSARHLELVRDYDKELVHYGYDGKVARLHLHSIAHFLVWLSLAGAELETADENTVVAFGQHRSAADVLAHHGIAAEVSAHACVSLFTVCASVGSSGPSPALPLRPVLWSMDSADG